MKAKYLNGLASAANANLEEIAKAFSSVAVISTKVRSNSELVNKKSAPPVPDGAGGG